MQKTYKNIDEFLEDLEHESLVDYVLDTGIFTDKDFKGHFVHCIFHAGDHTPSLQIMPKFFKCYACDAKGGFLKFVMMQKDLSFIDGIKELCDYFHCNIQKMRSVDTEKYNHIENEWQMYLRNMEHAPKEIQDLQKDYWPLQVGWDKQINYIVLPFTSKQNKILGFTKRVIGPVEAGIRPKWKHSSFQEGLQNKVHDVFNLGRATKEIVKTKQMIMTEGPKDVIAYLRIGLDNTICVCGTSNATNCFSLFNNLEKIILSFDHDEAGIKATINSATYLYHTMDINDIEVVVLPDGKDPYDLTRKELKECYSHKELALDYIAPYLSKQQALDLYNNTLAYNRYKIINKLCEIKDMNLQELKSWMNNSTKIIKTNTTEKEKLENIALGKDNNASLDDVKDAIKLLKLKYHENVEDLDAAK